MNPDIARKILPSINKRADTQFLSLYVEARLDVLRKNLEITSDLSEIYKLQGQIKEVKRLLTLREEVESILKN